jgi:integrase
MASVKALLYKSKKKADGRFPIVIRVIKNRKPKYIYIEWIEEKFWDKNRLQVKTSYPNSKRLNNLIRKKVLEAEDLILESESYDRRYTAQQITKQIKSERRTTSFFELAENYIADLEAMEKYCRASSDGAKLSRLKTFHTDHDLQFYEIDEFFLRKLRVYLIGKHKVSERTVMNYYVFIRTLFNLAIANRIIDAKYYPFGRGRIKIKFPETLKIGLDENEITAIEELDLKEKSPTWHARNVFLFSFYLAGIRVSDVVKMKWSDVKGDRIFYSMNKNQKSVSLKLPKRVLEIISYYKEDKQSRNDFIFPELKKADITSEKDIFAKVRTANRKFNKHLIKIAELANIDKKITMHIARHSFGNIASDKVSPQMLQKLYRHTSITTTIGYQGNFIHKEADDALDTVLDF